MIPAVSPLEYATLVIASMQSHPALVLDLIFDANWVDSHWEYFTLLHDYITWQLRSVEVAHRLQQVGRAGRVPQFVTDPIPRQ